LLLVSANAESQHVSYKLKSNHLEVKERGISLIQADLPFPVQVEESNWQFGKDPAAHQEHVLHACYMLPAGIIQPKLVSLHPRYGHMRPKWIFDTCSQACVLALADEYQGQKVITVTLQKVNGDSGYADWPHYKTQA